MGKCPGDKAGDCLSCESGTSACKARTDAHECDDFSFANASVNPDTFDTEVCKPYTVAATDEVEAVDCRIMVETDDDYDENKTACVGATATILRFMSVGLGIFALL